jgi:hypothetical protein
MFFLNSLREMVRTQELDRSRLGGGPRRTYRSRRLVIEALEDRLCPSTWSEPVDLGPVINGPGFDNRRPAISSDNLSLFFSSNRLGGSPDTGPLWVSHRASVDDPWGEPQELGPAINDPSATQTGAPNLSTDQHWLFFHSDRTDLGSEGGFDIYASYRPDTHDDFGWRTPINLGTGVNTPYGDYGPCYFEDPTAGTTTLYFNSDRPGGLGDYDIYASKLEGFARFGPAVLVPELSSPYRDTRMAIRSDGLEMFLTSNRPGGLGTGLNIWVSTRASTLDPWSLPENLGAPINVDGYNDGAPALSADGNTMYFYSNRPGSLGANDLWMSTREPTPSTFTVKNLHDSGPGSLRQAVLDANAHPGADTIRFAPSLHGTIALTSGQLAITTPLVIDGPGATRLTVSGSDAGRVFQVATGISVTIDGLTISHGLADVGAASTTPVL